MRRTALTIFVLGTVLQAAAQVSDPVKAAAILAQLEDAPTSAARFNLLNGRDFVFDFDAGVGVARGAGGNVTVANLADFPFLLGQGMSLAVGKMAPCGLSTPHYHPRATEFLYMISGSNLKVGFIQENGARFVSNILNPGQGAIFPKGSFHYQANLDCHPVTFVAGLNSEDPGVATVAQRFFGLPPVVVDATLGAPGVDEVVRIAQLIPDTFAIGVQSCLDKCNIKRGDQPKAQQQPRAGGNEFPGNPSNSKPDDKDKPNNQTKPDNKDNKGNYNSHNNQPPPDDDPENDWDNDEWYDDKHGGSPSPSNRGWWGSGVKKSPSDYHRKRSDVLNDRVTPLSAISSLISSADAGTLGELIFFLKLVLCVLLSGYVFVWAYFVVPTWRNRRLQAELQARAAASPSAPVQDVKT